MKKKIGKNVSISIHRAEHIISEVTKRVYKECDWRGLSIALGISPVLYEYTRPLRLKYKFTAWALDAIITKIGKTQPVPLYHSRSEFIREAFNDKYNKEMRLKQKPKIILDLKENEIAIPYESNGITEYEKKTILGDA